MLLFPPSLSESSSNTEWGSWTICVGDWAGREELKCSSVRVADGCIQARVMSGEGRKC